MTNISELEIDISRYWPEFYRDYADLMTIQEALNMVLKRIQAEIQAVHANNYVYTADEVGLARREKELGIIPPADATLDDRRVAIIARLNTRMPYTKRVLKRFLDNLVGADGYTIAIDYAGHKVTIRIELKRKNQVNAVGELLRKVLPANMLIDLQIRYNQFCMLKKFTFSELAAYTIEQLKSDPAIKDIFISRGGELI